VGGNSYHRRNDLCGETLRTPHLETVARIAIVKTYGEKNGQFSHWHCRALFVLPEGLTEGEVVRVVEFDHGYYNVECCNGRRKTPSSSLHRACDGAKSLTYILAAAITNQHLAIATY
jgi:hypothetical protein